MFRPGSALSKAKTKVNTNYGVNIPVKQVENKIPQLQDYIKNRDWEGAVVFLENEKSFSDSKPETSLWLAYAHFHNGDYQAAINLYDELMRRPDYNKEVHVYKGCCLYALCKYDEAKRECTKGSETPLQIRLMFHIAHKKNDEKNLMTYHHKLQETTHDQLCLAAIHYLRSHHEEATEIYKKLLLENREYMAINVYVALCYYKLDYYDVSLEILSTYLQLNPTSVMAVNLKACNQFQLYNGKAAEGEYKILQTNYDGGNVFQDNDLLKHNLVVFRGGENALHVLPRLIDIFPEARLNLVIHYLKNDEVNEAFNLIKDLEPSVPREYIIKGVVHAVLGQQTDSREHLKVSQQLFQLVGASASECDTIPGRQCMASCFFLLKQFDDVLVYLKSIKSFFENDEDFNWNYAIASAAAGEYQEAEAAFMKIQNEKYKTDDCYIRWLTRAYIMNGKPRFVKIIHKVKENKAFSNRLAWDLYINMETSNESFNLLQVIANDCYKMGQFYYSAKAFDILERLDSNNEYEEALKGSVVGVFQMVIVGKETKEHLVEVMNMLKNAVVNNPQVEYIFRVVKKWGKDNGLKI